MVSSDPAESSPLRSPSCPSCSLKSKILARASATPVRAGILPPPPPENGYPDLKMKKKKKLKKKVSSADTQKKLGGLQGESPPTPTSF